MFIIKRIKLFSGVSRGRESINKYKYQLLNHIVLFMLSSSRLVYDKHWNDEIINYLNNLLSGYDNKSFMKNFNFNEVFENFINKGKDYNLFISELRKKFRNEFKNDKNKSIEYPEEFINSQLLDDILKDIINKFNEWKYKNSKKPILDRNDPMNNINEFSNILYDIRDSHKSELTRYGVRYKIRYYSNRRFLYE